MAAIFNHQKQRKTSVTQIHQSVLCFFFFVCFVSAQAQKKVSLVSQSTTTSIALPAGSKLDKRMISEIAGKGLLQMEAKKMSANVTSVEILYLPGQSGFTADSLVKALSTNEWSVAVLESDNKYALLKKGNRSVLAYFEITNTEVNLYFGEINSTQPGMEGTTTPDQGNTVTPLPPAPPVQTNEQTTEQTTHQNTEQVQQQIQEPVHPTTTAPVADGFTFNISNFDDGWTSTVQQDWVEVTKGSIKVLLHYPKEGTIFPADPDVLTTAAWNILVAPRYSNLRNYKTAYISTYNRPYLGMGTAVETASGKEVFVVLFRQGQTGWVEFVCPDKNAFIQQFNFDAETIQWDSESSLMDRLSAMVNYNKFAVAASDFNGKWTSDFTGVQQLYSIYTGNYAGMNINQSNEEFVFNGNSYSWKLLVVNGMVGNMNYNQVASTGSFTVLNNWQVKFSKIEKGPKTYHAFWSCIKGTRILNLLDAEYPGSGIYTKYGLSK